MISIIYNRKYHRVTVDGHASSAPKGEDLICAAVSHNVRMLEDRVSHMDEAGFLDECYVVIEDGHAEIQVTPVRPVLDVCNIQFDDMCCGFELLAGQYPEYVSYEMHC